ncbi:MAG: metal ABC transporter ATP-binding protein [Brevinema sp.]
MLCVKNLNVVLESETILNNINFSLTSGKILAIIGPNGSGKTTLLKSILGLQQNYTGSILLNNQTIAHTIKEHSIGYLPQYHQTNTLLPLTVFDSVAQGIKSQKKWFEILNQSEKDKIQEVLEKVKLWDRKDDLFEKLSGGQKQRVLLALALVNNPRFLFLDEPSSALDVGSIKIIYELLKELRDKYHVGILIISHDINGIVNIADEVALLMHEIKYIGPTNTLPQQAIHDVFGLHLQILSSDPTCDICKSNS